MKNVTEGDPSDKTSFEFNIVTLRFSLLALHFIYAAWFYRTWKNGITDG